MIVITHIECHEFEGDAATQHMLEEFILNLSADTYIRKPINELKIAKEIIHGRRYINARGERVVIGISGQGAKAVGLLLNENKTYAMKIKNLEDRLELAELEVQATDELLQHFMKKLWLRRFRVWLHDTWRLTLRPILLGGWW
jgi:hypothetical protein